MAALGLHCNPLSFSLWCLGLFLICGILVPWRGIEPRSPALGALGLSHWSSLVAQLVKNPPAMQETWVRSLGLENTLEKGKSTHSSFLAWRIPWTIHRVAKSRTRLNDFHFHFPPGKPLPVILTQLWGWGLWPFPPHLPLSDPLRPPSPPDLQPPWPSSRRLHLSNSAFTYAVPFAWYTLPYTAPSSQLKNFFGLTMWLAGF